MRKAIIAKALRYGVKPYLVIAASTVTILSFQNCGEGFNVIQNLQSVAGTNQPEYIEESAEFAQGRDLYNQNCAGCHGVFANSTISGKSLIDIKAAIANVPQMFAFQALSETQLQLIALALNPGSPGTVTPTPTPSPSPTATATASPSPTTTATATPSPTVSPSPTVTVPANTFACQPGEDPGVRDFRRLSRREYLQTLKLLSYGRVNIDSLQSDIDNLPADVVTGVFDSTDATVSAAHVEAYLNLGKKIANLFATSSTWRAAAMNNCNTTNGMTETCWTSFFNGFGRLVFRRPLTTAEQQIYKDLYNSEFGGNLNDGLTVAIMAMLQSPNFIYKNELSGTPVNGREDLVKITDYELASRIAFLATGRGPDTALMNDAVSGNLATVEGYKTAVNRVFATAESKEHIAEFYNQWLGINRMPSSNHSTWFLGNVPRASIQPEAMQEMRDFTNYFTYSVAGSYKDMMTSSTSFTQGQALTLIYGAAKGEALSPEERPGLMSRVGFMFSPTDNSSLVHRGLVIRRNILCDSIPLPTIAADEKELFAPPVPDPTQSQRQQIETRTSPVRCQACHSLINPMGFVMENYNAFGKYRTVESIFDANGNILANHPVNAKVKPNIESANEAEVNGLKEMSIAIANSSRGPACMVKQWSTYTMGRAVTAADNCAMNTSFSQLTDPGKSSSSGDQPGTILNMIKSPAFDANFRLRKRGAQ
ncbi:DUF1588 domain-containing protein [Bdellovibrio sp. SKB1291214]|uniref:DUF1588 domain-containing protein n=1 Tax=Bdellovibrio sp. SKB1291214 TaxID=1732569 RepID=UPI000B51E27C|nr:DUF1588 domain-containing protein [Bdellovibrio sp. SKB1291214]UYL09408.1 DUF1588 domain-containing protein [Bdellovibrio sp. SKB1291214]